MARSAGRWGMDLFNPEALTEMGITLSKGFVTGAMAGAVVDVFTAGLSLGTAALVGGLLGSAWQGIDKLGKRVMGRLQGYQTLSVADEVVLLLQKRSVLLIEALERRGHAAQQAVVLHTIDTQGESTCQLSNKEQEVLEQARAHPEWSSLSEDFQAEKARQEAIKTWAQQLSS